MLKLVGGCCVICAGIWVFLSAVSEERRRLELLRRLAEALEIMGDEIRMNRTPMPRLLKKLEAGGKDEVSAFFASVRLLCEEIALTDAWRHAAENLPLPEAVKSAFLELGNCLSGDEEQACRGIAFMKEQLRRDLECRRTRMAEAMRYRAAVCFSAAVMVVILLI